jgi:hypothetical protein
MTRKTPIKIIKRDERNRSENNKQVKPPKESAQEAARDMVATVTNWVNEFQQKRRVETKQAIRTLFNEQPQPSEA